MTKEDLIKRTLKDLAVRPALKGYPMLVDAISICVDDVECLDKVTTRLYVQVAKLHGSTMQRAERNMRSAVMISYSSAPADVLKEMIGNIVPYHKDVPTLKNYIAAVAEYVRDELKREATACSQNR